MLRPAQCEKAVTIPEPMGRFPKGPRVCTGWKSSIDWGTLAPASPVAESRGSTNSCLSGDFSPIFNGLQAGKDRRLKRLGRPVHDVRKGNFVCTRGGRFGPNFVTIQPLGVCVCSI